MTQEDRSAIAVLAARFAESTNEIMRLAEAIENAIDRRLAQDIARTFEQNINRVIRGR